MTTLLVGWLVGSSAKQDAISNKVDLEGRTLKNENSAPHREQLGCSFAVSHAGLVRASCAPPEDPARARVSPVRIMLEASPGLVAAAAVLLFRQSSTNVFQERAGGRANSVTWQEEEEERTW
jgi:hypothetical protein